MYNLPQLLWVRWRSPRRQRQSDITEVVAAMAAQRHQRAGACGFVFKPFGALFERAGDQRLSNLGEVSTRKPDLRCTGCGDGVKQAGEQCDDNNDVAGDGCSPTCMAEAPYEIEPNNTYLTATPPWPSFSTWKGSISPVGDRDYYQFTLATVASPTLVTHDPDSPTTCGFDTVIHLLDGNGMQIVQDDEGGPGGCSKIDPTTHPQVKDLPAGTYYVWVQRYNDSMTIPLYQLDLTIQ